MKSLRAAVIAFTENGLRTADICRTSFADGGMEAGLWLKKREMPAVKISCSRVEESLREWTGKRFADCDLLCFVGATGIAVRAIAPFVVSKTADPAVLCVDEKGQYVISLLSGHIGGANEAAGLLAGKLGAIPIITTATDLNHRFAVDVFAKNNELLIRDMRIAKEISAAVLDGNSIGFFSEIPWEGDLPEQLYAADGDAAYRIHISGDIIKDRDTDSIVSNAGSGDRSDTDKTAECGQVLYLDPKWITLGIGCRRDTDPEQLEIFVTETLQRCGINLSQIRQVCSIDLKAKEKAITQFCDAHTLPYRTFSAEQLQNAEGTFEGSAFVRRTTGVDNVCERSAVLGSGQGRLILKKTAENGMTLAAAIDNRRIVF